MGIHSADSSVGTRTDYAGSKTYVWSVFALTFLLMLFDFIDRQIIVSMLPFIKAEWNLSDTQLGGMISIVSLTVGLFSIPVAVVADRWSRTKSIFAMAFVWSLATIGCAFATSYTQLLYLRGVVGIGEAGYNAVGSALLANLFPSRMRAAILASFAAAAAIGAVLGVVLGGVISKHYGWHATFGIVGAPGLVLALLYLLVRDYKTIDVADPLVEGSPSQGVGRSRSGLVAMARAIATSPSALLIYIGGAFQLFVVSTIYSWLPSFLNREYGLPADQAGIRAALVLIASSLGAIVWGYLADRISRKRASNKIHIMAFSAASSAAVLALAFGYFKPGPSQFATIMLGGLLMTGTLGTVGAVAIDVVHPGVRATAVAAGVLIQNLFGLAAGPFISGILSDKYGLAGALAMVPLFGLLAATAFLLTVRPYERDLRLAAQRPVGFPNG